MKNKTEEHTFPEISHFLFTSFIYITRLSGLIKGTASYIYQPFCRWRSSGLLSRFMWERHCWGLLSISSLILSVSGRSRPSEGNILSWAMAKGQKQHDAFHPTGMLSLPEPPKLVEIESRVFSYLFLNKVFQHLSSNSTSIVKFFLTSPAEKDLPSSDPD